MKNFFTTVAVGISMLFCISCQKEANSIVTNDALSESILDQ